MFWEPCLDPGKLPEVKLKYLRHSVVVLMDSPALRNMGNLETSIYSLLRVLSKGVYVGFQSSVCIIVHTSWQSK